jgi:hypothetical protein
MSLYIFKDKIFLKLFCAGFTVSVSNRIIFYIGRKQTWKKGSSDSDSEGQSRRKITRVIKVHMFCYIN